MIKTDIEKDVRNRSTEKCIKLLRDSRGNHRAQYRFLVRCLLELLSVEFLLTNLNVLLNISVQKCLFILLELALTDPLRNFLCINFAFILVKTVLADENHIGQSCFSIMPFESAT